jgi:hypothetical protein
MIEFVFALSFFLSNLEKTSHYFHNFVLRNYHFRITAGQDLVLWMFDTVKQSFKEHCIWCNYTLFIWVIFRDQKKYIITAEQWRRNNGYFLCMLQLPSSYLCRNYLITLFAFQVLSVR